MVILSLHVVMMMLMGTITCNGKDDNGYNYKYGNDDHGHEQSGMTKK